MKAIVFTTASLAFASALAACATGVYGTSDSTSSHKDGGGIISKGDSGSGGSTGADSGGNLPPDQGGGGGGNGCSGTMCGADCVDTSSDPLNCGTCGNACDTSSTCTGGQCVATGGGGNTTNEPPVGTCSHSLCASGGALSEGCDTAGCSTVICDPSYVGDDYCCSTSWDSQCVSEVDLYCAPYSCQ